MRVLGGNACFERSSRLREKDTPARKPSWQAGSLLHECVLKEALPQYA